MPKESRQRMISDLRTLAGELPSEGAGPHVALRANLERDFTLGEKVHQRWIFNGCEAMADALDSEQVNGFADFFRAAHFASMNQPMEAKLRRAVVNASKLHSGDLELVAADAEGDDPLRAATLCILDDGHRGFCPKLPHSVKNPPEAQAAPLERFCGAKQSFKVCFRLLLSQKHHTDRKRDFRVDDILFEQLLPEIAGDESVVLRLTQKRGEPLEGFKEAWKVAEGITLKHLLPGRFHAVTGHQCERCGRLDRTFQMQMKFSLGEGVDSRGERTHPEKSMRQCGAAGIVPGSKPEGANIGRGIRELADQNGPGFIIEVVVVFVGVGSLSAKRIAVGQENRLEPAMRAEASIEGMVRGV